MHIIDHSFFFTTTHYDLLITSTRYLLMPNCNTNINNTTRHFTPSCLFISARNHIYIATLMHLTQTLKPSLQNWSTLSPRCLEYTIDICTNINNHLMRPLKSDVSRRLLIRNWKQKNQELFTTSDNSRSPLFIYSFIYSFIYLSLFLPSREI
jgi:hypothetical protein